LWESQLLAPLGKQGVFQLLAPAFLHPILLPSASLSPSPLSHTFTSQIHLCPHLPASSHCILTSQPPLTCVLTPSLLSLVPSLPRFTCILTSQPPLTCVLTSQSAHTCTLTPGCSYLLCHDVWFLVSQCQIKKLGDRNCTASLEGRGFKQNEMAGVFWKDGGDCKKGSELKLSEETRCVGQCRLGSLPAFPLVIFVVCTCTKSAEKCT
jgi:hypothetical protein